jgi:hypothetical protein
MALFSITETRKNILFFTFGAFHRSCCGQPVTRMGVVNSSTMGGRGGGSDGTLDHPSFPKQKNGVRN